MRLARPSNVPRALLALLCAAFLVHLIPACGGGGGGDGGQSATIAFLATGSSGDESATPAHLTLELSGPLATDSATVDVTITGGTASAGADFTLTTTSVTIPAGQTQGTVDLDIIQDGFDEPDETVEVTLSNPRAGGRAALTLGQARVHTYTINAQSASATPTLSLRAPAQSLDEGVGISGMVVQLSSAAASTVTVNYALSGGTATSGADFSFTPGTLSFPPGSTVQTIPIQIAEDLVDEDDETVMVALTGPVGAQLGGPTTATLTILDNDPTPNVAFTSSNVSANEGDGTAQIPVSLSSASGRDVSVAYGASGGTATGNGVDYTLVSGTLVIPAGQTSGSIPVTLVNDTAAEGNESVTVSLSSPVNAVIGAVAQGGLTIVDDDGLPLVEFASATSSALENGGARTISVVLSAPVPSNVQVSYTVGGGTATSGVDYNLSNGTVIFTPNQTTASIPIGVLGDSIDEDDETVIVTLSSPINASLGAKSVHTFTITDDDPSPLLTFSGSNFTASESTASPTVNVLLTGATARTVTVDYSVTGGTATGSGVDYTLASGTLTFTPGQTTKTLTLSVVNDALNEATETVNIALSSPVNGTLGSPASTVFNITDDDPVPTISFFAATSSGSESATSPAITVNLSTASGRAVTVSYAAGAGGTATGGGTDYTLATGTLTIPAGQTSMNVPISVVNDTIDEPNETVVINLTSPGNATLVAPSSHTYTINDDDPPPTINFQLASSAGAESATSVLLVVSLSSASSQTVQVGYSVTGGTATGGGTDFSGGSGTLSFSSGIQNQNVLLNVVNDNLNENDETVVVTLSSPVNGTLGAQTSHTYTIQDNDPLPTVQFLQTLSSQLESVTTPVIAVTLSPASGRVVTVAFAATGGTATSPSDYTLGTSPLTIPAGTTSLSLPLTVVNDTVIEPNETINFQLSSPTNATLGAQAAHTFTILNND